VRITNRLAAVGIVGVAVIAACIGNLTLEHAESEQHSMSYPGSASAGNVMIGSSGTTQPIVFSPLTVTDNDTIMTITETCANWSLNLNTLPARVYCDTAIGGETYGSGSCVPVTYSFTGTFTPTGPGQNSCPVTVTWAASGLGSNGSDTGNIQTLVIGLNGIGVAPAYAMTVTPAMGTPLEYTDIPINVTSSTQQITVTNTGTSSLTVMGTNSNPTLFPLMGVNNANLASQVLGIGQSARFDVACHPPGVQDYTGTITFRTSSSQGNLSRTVDLECNGISSSLVINPNPAGFARNTLVGQPPAELVINVMNNGAQTAFTDVRLESGTAVTITQQPVTPLPGGSATTIRLAYDAAAEHPFGRIDNLIITHTPGGTRTVAINAEALVGEIGVTPALVDFGPICPGSEKTSDLMVYATSSGPVNLMSITQPGSPFSVTGAGGPLEPNHGNIITLTARVSVTSAGDLDDAFLLNTNLPGAAATHEVKLAGIALPSGVTPTPNVVHFGPGRVGSPTTAKKVTISNCGTSALEITGAYIEGLRASEFAIVSPEDPLQTIPTMGALEFLVIMNPATTGTKTAKLVVEHAGGRIEADLDGNGFGVSDEGGDKTTYYTCSAGGAAHGLPLVLALAGLVRRRRRAA
jgi:hypothetical protein